MWFIFRSLALFFLYSSLEANYWLTLLFLIILFVNYILFYSSTELKTSYDTINHFSLESSRILSVEVNHQKFFVFFFYWRIAYFHFLCHFRLFQILGSASILCHLELFEVANDCLTSCRHNMSINCCFHATICLWFVGWAVFFS